MNQKTDKLEVICGPMFSGKTEALIKRANEFIRDKKTICIFKPSIDNRYSKNYIVSHNNKKIKCHTIKSSKEILNYINDSDIIAIDEVQFFDIEIINVLTKIISEGKSIIVAGLDRDYRAKPFLQISNLIELSNNITRLNAICVKCGDIANFSYRKTNDISRVLIGESEKYEPRCEKCYYNKKGYK